MWKDGTFCVLDLESTGLDLQKDRIIQIALEMIVEGRRAGSWSAYVDPGMEVPEETVAIHKLTNARLRELDAITFEYVIDDFLDRIGGVDAIIAYNGPRGDIPLLQAEFKRLDVIFPDDIPIIDPFVWIKELDRALKGKYRFGLQTTAKRWGVGLLEGEVAHDAVTDVRMCTDLWIEIMNHKDVTFPSDFDAFMFMQNQLALRQEQEYQMWRSKKK